MSSSSTPAASGELPPSPESSVFLNCPYDDEFRPLFDALIFAVVACGFSPRSALENKDSATPRVSRILEATFTSRFSIHDLSRCRGEGDANLARFNMPLELGMAMAKRHADQLSGQDANGSHHWLALVPASHDYRLYASDLGGFDLESYDGSPEDIVAASMGWISDRAPTPVPLSPRRVSQGLPRFQEELLQLRADWRGRQPWERIVGCAKRISAELI